MIARLVTTPEDIDFLKELLAAAEMLRILPFPVDLWKVQNLYHEMLKFTYPEFQTRVQRGNEAAQEWLNQFVPLGQQLSIRVG